MSLFSLALTNALSSCRMTQTELGNKAEIAVTQINRYTSGRSDLRPLLLERILRVFPQEESAKLLCAYLLDQCPTEFRHLVDIHTVNTKVRKSTADALAYLPPDVRQSLAYLGSKCDQPHVLEFIKLTVRILRCGLDKPEPPRASA